MVFFTVMMVCLHQHFFSLFYDYFQTSLNNDIGMPQFSSNTSTSPGFSIIFQAVQDTLAPWDSQILHQSLRVSASSSGTGCSTEISLL